MPLVPPSRLIGKNTTRPWKGAFNASVTGVAKKFLNNCTAALFGRWAAGAALFRRLFAWKWGEAGVEEGVDEVCLWCSDAWTLFMGYQG